VDKIAENGCGDVANCREACRLDIVFLVIRTGGCDGRLAGTGIFAWPFGAAANSLWRIHWPDLWAGSGKRAGESGGPATCIGQRFPSICPGESEALPSAGSLGTW